jgi:hypothetical protein
MSVEVGRRGVFTDAKEGAGVAYEVRSLSGTGNTIYAVNDAGEAKKFVKRKDGHFRETGFRTGHNLVFASEALESMDGMEAVLATLSENS